MEDHSLNGYLLVEYGGFLVASMVKNLPVMRADQPANPGLIKAQEDPMEKGMATHSGFLPGEFHGQRSLVGYSSWGRKESDMT